MIDLTLDQRVLEALQYQVTSAASREMMHGSERWQLAIEEMGHNMVARLRRELYQEKVDHVDATTETWTREVPWSCFVWVELPQTWLRRLFRRPARKIQKPVTGKVKVSGRVVCRAERFARFPDLDPDMYPDRFGRPITYIRYDHNPMAVLDTRQTSPRWGAAEWNE